MQLLSMMDRIPMFEGVLNVATLLAVGHTELTVAPSVDTIIVCFASPLNCMSTDAAAMAARLPAFEMKDGGGNDFTLDGESMSYQVG